MAFLLTCWKTWGCMPTHSDLGLRNWEAKNADAGRFVRRAGALKNRKRGKACAPRRGSYRCAVFLITKSSGRKR